MLFFTILKSNVVFLRVTHPKAQCVMFSPDPNVGRAKWHSNFTVSFPESKLHPSPPSHSTRTLASWIVCVCVCVCLCVWERVCMYVCVWITDQPYGCARLNVMSHHSSVLLSEKSCPLCLSKWVRLGCQESCQEVPSLPWLSEMSLTADVDQIWWRPVSLVSTQVQIVLLEKKTCRLMPWQTSLDVWERHEGTPCVLSYQYSTTCVVLWQSDSSTFSVQTRLFKCPILS